MHPEMKSRLVALRQRMTTTGAGLIAIAPG